MANLFVESAKITIAGIPMQVIYRALRSAGMLVFAFYRKKGMKALGLKSGEAASFGSRAGIRVGQRGGLLVF
jgi:hypothetical protein